MIYLDNAATTHPKPESVYAAADTAARGGGNAGRGAHSLSRAASNAVDDARNRVARLFGVSDYRRVVFTLNTTDALNLAIKGALSDGNHVLISSLEHNSVVRPLEAMRKLGVEYERVPTSPSDGVSADDVRKLLRPNTKMLAVTHISNVTGARNPIAELGALCRERSVLFLLDAAQSAGSAAIDVDAMNVDLLAFPAHKGLYGLQGAGGLYIRDGIDLAPQRHGGTGSHSELRAQPDELPDRYESGTMNVPSLASLAAGVEYVARRGVENIGAHETALANRLIDGLTQVRGVTVYGAKQGANRSGVVSLNIENVAPTDAAAILDGSFDIAARAGLHCAPDAHSALGTLESGGTLRLSVGAFNTDSDIDACLTAIDAIASGAI
ncbi:MAG: aminotransferase class V-fold PLP-dependent enzyme [Oscillospiraceae bacterium]|jgi:cysteine desulfurase family protein|nr:aminotransferase class V-fold PLP-dependent enzyme [Oscillospiraceae bacterium]